jgi:thiol:disulfide interchange protein/DsbC/DsbD-like thiol-disulfide interchange protein
LMLIIWVSFRDWLTRLWMAAGLGLGLGLTLLLAAVSAPSWAQSDALLSGKPAVVTPPRSAQGLAALLDKSPHVVVTDQVRTELMVYAPKGIQAGQTFWLGLHIKHQPDWHTYWQNPGDSGLPTRLQWQLPEGLQAGDIAWPVPKKIPIGTLANYGYEGSVLLAVPVTANATFKWPAQAPLTLQLKAEWLVCRQECIPQEGQLALNLSASSPLTQQAALFEASRKLYPQTLPQLQKGDQWISGGEAALSGDGRQLELRVFGLPAELRGQTLSAFPITAHVVHNAAAQGKDWTQKWQGTTWTAKIPVSEDRSESPSTLRWLLATGPESSPKAPTFEIDVPVIGQWPALAVPAPAEISPALAKALAENALANASASANASAKTNALAGTTAMGLTLAILGALLGGLLLNLMPCVFPVLAIKVLGFAQTPSAAAQAPHAHRAAGLAYTAGVVLSFLLLGGLMLALRAAGEQLGWGFQLQSPLVVAALALLFTLLGLNLAGVFEFGNLLPSSWATVQSRHPTVDAALSGVLAVAVASPCTAPFMGASLGLAIALPVWQALAVFAAMGLGMALPYLAASYWPGIARALPRPGAWMVVFRQAMAFPMFATVIWLLWVLGQQTGIDGVSGLLAVLLSVAGLAWSLGLKGRIRWLLSGLFGGLIVWWCAIGLSSLGGVTPAEAPRSTNSDNAIIASVNPSSPWQNWSAQAQQAQLDAGRPVFVDFTAAWCVTCQYNKKTTLADAQLLADFSARKVTLMRADWTRRDPAITQALTSLGRSGVPVYVLYVPQQPPVLFSELPSVAEIRGALQKLPANP